MNFFDENMNYKLIVLNIQAIKQQYEEALSLFSYLDKKLKIKFMRSVKKSVYNLKFEEWKKNKIWEYINGFEELDTLLKFI